MFNIGLLEEWTRFGTRTFPMQIFDGIVFNVASGWNRGIRMRNGVPMWMRFSCLNSTVVGHAISGGKSIIARVKIGPFLPVVSNVSMCCDREYSK